MQPFKVVIEGRNFSANVLEVNSESDLNFLLEDLITLGRDDFNSYIITSRLCKNLFREINNYQKR
jgi:hypothetical protein